MEMADVNMCCDCAGGQELRRVESRLKSSARPYVPLSPAVHQQSPAQRSGPTRIADTQVGFLSLA